MFTAFSTALSALNADTTAIAVVGNNLANLNTDGFKESEVSFSDLVTQSLGAGLGGPASAPVLKRLAVLHCGGTGEWRAQRCLTSEPFLNEHARKRWYPILFPYTCPSLRTAQHASLLLYTLRL